MDLTLDRDINWRGRFPGLLSPIRCPREPDLAKSFAARNRIFGNHELKNQFSRRREYIP